MNNSKTFNVGDIVKRPEVLTLIVAVIVSALAASGVADKAGAPLPEKEIGVVVATFWAIFVGAVFEGKYKGVDYAGGLKQLVKSSKFRLGIVLLVGMVLNAALEPFGYSIDEATLTTVGNFCLLAVLGIAGVDGWNASRP